MVRGTVRGRVRGTVRVRVRVRERTESSLSLSPVATAPSCWLVRRKGRERECYMDNWVSGRTRAGARVRVRVRVTRSRVFFQNPMRLMLTLRWSLFLDLAINLLHSKDQTDALTAPATEINTEYETIGVY